MSPNTSIDDAVVADVQHAIATSLLPSLEKHLDELADLVSKRHQVDVELTRVLLAHELARATSAMREVSVGRAIALKRTLKSIATVSGTRTGSHVHARFPRARSVAQTQLNVDSSKRAQSVIVDGWRFVMRPRAAR